MAGLNWQAVHDRELRKLQAAKTEEGARGVIQEMVHLLPSSHLAVIPAWMYSATNKVDRLSSPHSGGPDAPDNQPGNSGQGSTGIGVAAIGRKIVVEFVEPGSAAAEAGIHPGWIVESIDGTPVNRLFNSRPGIKAEADIQEAIEMVQLWLDGPVGSSIRLSFQTGDDHHATADIARRVPPGVLLQFGNLPPEHVSLEYRRLPNGAGYIRLNLFLDPVVVMPALENAIREFRDAPGIVLDLRNNPGGLGVMAMGVAGWFVSNQGLRLGTMTGRGLHMNFEINPRLEPYTGRLAILVNQGSASTTEILAQGLQDLGRARVFGTRTAGAALPSEIIDLPDGDRFQYPEANYVSVKGRVLEGNGVKPDVMVAPAVEALLAGRDLPLEAAMAWCKICVPHCMSREDSK